MKALVAPIAFVVCSTDFLTVKTNSMAKSSILHTHMLNAPTQEPSVHVPCAMTFQEGYLASMFAMHCEPHMCPSLLKKCSSCTEQMQLAYQEGVCIPATQGKNLVKCHRACMTAPLLLHLSDLQLRPHQCSHSHTSNTQLTDTSSVTISSLTQTASEQQYQKLDAVVTRVGRCPTSCHLPSLGSSLSTLFRY